MEKQWKDNARISLDVELVDRELRRIERQRGLITPSEVVEQAKDPESPLHRAFEWDDRVAGHKYRLQQARKLIAAVVIPDKRSDENRSVRAYANVITEEGKRGYRTLYSVMRQPDTRAYLLKQARRDMETFRQKYGHLSELATLFEAIEQVLHEYEEA